MNIFSTQLLSTHFKINLFLIYVVLVLVFRTPFVISVLVLIASVYIYFLSLMYFNSKQNLMNFSLMNTNATIKALNLLPKDYCANQIPIYVFYNHFQYILFCIFFPTSKGATTDLSKDSGGFFSFNNIDDIDDKSSVKIVVFANNYKFLFLHALYHELRHYYQFLKGYQRKNFLNHQSVSTSLNYNAQLIEIEANMFASHFIKSNKQKLKQYFNFKYRNFSVTKKREHGYYMTGYVDNTPTYKIIKLQKDYGKKFVNVGKSILDKLESYDCIYNNIKCTYKIYRWLLRLERKLANL